MGWTGLALRKAHGSRGAGGVRRAGLACMIDGIFGDSAPHRPTDEEYLFRDRVHNILHDHDQSKPLFLTYASKIVHCKRLKFRHLESSF